MTVLMLHSNYCTNYRVNLGRPVVGGPDGVGGSFLSKMKTRVSILL